MLKEKDEQKSHYMRIAKIELILAITISFVATFVATAHFFSQYLQRPPEHVFVGQIHYLQDYYYYLDQFYQGAEGNWLTENRFTSEEFSPSFVYLSHIILGKIGGLFGLKSFESYNLSVLILKFIFIFLSYFIYVYFFPESGRNRIFAFLIFLFSTSFPPGSYVENGEKIYLLRRVWGTQNLIESRFGNIPNNLAANIIFVAAVLVVLSIFKSAGSCPKRIDVVKQTGYLFTTNLLIVLLTILDPFIASIFVCGLVLLLLIFILEKHKLKNMVVFYGIFLLSVLLSFFFAFILVKETAGENPVYRHAVNWDIDQYFIQLKSLSFAEHFLSFGNLAIIFALGLPLFLKQKMTAVRRLGLIFIILSFAGLILPFVFSLRIPGHRFIFSSTYIFLSAVSVYGFLIFEKVIKNKQLVYVLVFAYLLFNLYTFRFSFINYTKPLTEPSWHFAYMPESLYQGLLFLSNEPKKSVVLANSWSDVDLMIPGLTGKKTYSGHLLTTHNSWQKSENSKNFFMDSEHFDNPSLFLKNNNISYVVYTSYDGDVEKFAQNYSFLSKIFKNDSVSIFTALGK